MPFYVFQSYYESVKEELKNKKKANEEQIKNSEKRNTKFKKPRMKPSKFR